MRFSKVSIPLEQTKKKRLKEIKLINRPLGSTVALVGRNGAGKSRILNFISNYTSTITPEDLISGYIINMPGSLAAEFNDHKTKNSPLVQKLLQGDVSKQIRQSFLNSISPFVTKFRYLSKAYIKIIDNDELKVIKDKIDVEGKITFENILSNLHQDNYIANVTNPSIGKLVNEMAGLSNSKTIEYFQKLSKDILKEQINLYIENQENLPFIKSEIEKKRPFQLFKIFQGYVEKFLSLKISYKQASSGDNIQSTLLLDDEPFDLSLLSPGQKTLFAYAVLFFVLDVNSQTSIKESIIIIDEPEKHLHPEAQIALIKALKSIVGSSGQLWIATHSINILAHLNFDEIFLVKDHEIIPPSRTTPGNSYLDLMGVNEHIQELSSFVNSISDWAFGSFMAQCFKEPEVIFSTPASDPQYVLFKEFLSGRSSVSILDYGAGKGRIGYTLCEDNELSQKIFYSAYDPDPENIPFLTELPGVKSIYKTPQDIPDNSFDVVILCNVFHEIDPKEWDDMIDEIFQALTNTGYLIIIEDKFLPKGENANDVGYLIFDAKQFKVLFETDKCIELKLKDKGFNERIVFVAFEKEYVHCQKDSIVAAIKSLKDATYNEIKLLRNSKSGLDQGRKYANQVQLYINSILAIEAINSEKI